MKLQLMSPLGTEPASMLETESAEIARIVFRGIFFGMYFF